MKLSVVLCTHRDGRPLNSPLNAILESMRVLPPGSGEVLVAINSLRLPDDSIAYQNVVDLIGNDSDLVRLVSTGEPGLLASRHLGAKLARGEILAFIDDDFLVSETWAETIVNVFDNAGTVIATGPSLPIYESPPPSRISKFTGNVGGGREVNLVLSLLSFGKKSEDLIPVSLVFGQNFIIKRRTFYEFNGFNPDIMPKQLWAYTGDGEYGLAAKLERAGLQAVFSWKLAGNHLISKSRMSRRGITKRAKYDASVFMYRRVRNQSRSSFVGLTSHVLTTFLRKISSQPDKRYWLVHTFFSLMWVMKWAKSEELRSWVKRDSYISCWSPI